MALAPSAVRRVARELADLANNPPDGVAVVLGDDEPATGAGAGASSCAADDLSSVRADLAGPEGTPYSGGTFRVRLALAADHPHAPPRGYFLTKIWHPNVGPGGEICVNVLKKDWTPATTLRHVFSVVRCLLIAPFPESALNEEAGRQLLEDYESYAERARLMTSLHAARRGGGGGGSTAGGAAGGKRLAADKAAAAAGAAGAAAAAGPPSSAEAPQPRSPAAGSGGAQAAAAAPLTSASAANQPSAAEPGAGIGGGTEDGGGGSGSGGGAAAGSGGGSPAAKKVRSGEDGGAGLPRPPGAAAVPPKKPVALAKAAPKGRSSLKRL
jgi:ubiquitin-conjugating enzyme E2 S